MKIRQSVNRLRRTVDNLQTKSHQPAVQPNSGKGKSKYDDIIITALNNSDTAMAIYDCVRLFKGTQAIDIPNAEHPYYDDDNEKSIYASVVKGGEPGELVFVKITGKLIFRIGYDEGDENYAEVGQKIYPLDYSVNSSKKGLVGTKKSNLSDCIGSGIGRLLNSESEDTELVSVLVGNVGGTPARQMKIVSVEVDHLLCHEWDGENEGDVSIEVALPWLLRRSPFDEQTREGWTFVYTDNQTREVSKEGEADETHIIAPPLLVGDVIGVEDCEPIICDPYGASVTAMLIMKNDGRAWGRDPDEE